jgi:hypothetical protein
LSRTTQTTTAHKTAGQKLPSTPMTLWNLKLKKRPESKRSYLKSHHPNLYKSCKRKNSASSFSLLFLSCWWPSLVCTGKTELESEAV